MLVAPGHFRGRASSRIWAGTRVIARAGYIQWPANSPTSGVFTICTATWGNGVWRRSRRGWQGIPSRGRLWRALSEGEASATWKTSAAAPFLTGRTPPSRKRGWDLELCSKSRRRQGQQPGAISRPLKKNRNSAQEIRRFCIDPLRGGQTTAGFIRPRTILPKQDDGRELRCLRGDGHEELRRYRTGGGVRARLKGGEYRSV